MLHLKRVIEHMPKEHPSEPFAPIMTTWGRALADQSSAQPLSEHPRPGMARKRWACLNGWWDCDILPAEDAATAWMRARAPEKLRRSIRVPFSPETRLSGVSRVCTPLDLLFYRKTFDVASLLGDLGPDDRVLLHFDAVDYACAVYANDALVTTHTGGYMPFTCDVTDAARTGSLGIEVVVYDPTDEGTQLRGKQRLSPGGMWYSGQSGIWKTVWLEVAPQAHIVDVSLRPDVVSERLVVKAGVVPGAQTLSVRVMDAMGAIVGSARGAVLEGEKSASVTVDVEHARLWDIDDPYLYSVEICYGSDTVRSYTAFRSVAVRADANGHPRFFLNGRPILLRGVLEQGYWPESLMTPPSDEALLYDIQEAHELGFNMMRMHVKIESERWYYHCDRTGMLVWQDMVNGGGDYDVWATAYAPTLFRTLWTRVRDSEPHWEKMGASDPAYRDEWTRTCADTVRLLGNHPCIISWTLFNESWGQFLSREACDMVRALDPTRPINAVDAWFDQGAGDYHAVHNYFRDMTVWRERAGRRTNPRAFMISEVGGLTLLVQGHSSLDRAYGYDTYEDPDTWRKAVRDLIDQLNRLETDGLAGYVFTQLTDIEEEANGLLTYDRRVNKLLG